MKAAKSPAAGGQRLQQLRHGAGPGTEFAGQAQVQHLVAGGHADTRRFLRRQTPGASVWQVLHREVGVGGVGRFDLDHQFGVMGRAEFNHGEKASFKPAQQAAYPVSSEPPFSAQAVGTKR